MNRSITEQHGQVKLSFSRRGKFFAKKTWSCTASAPWGAIGSSRRTFRGVRRSALKSILRYENYDQFGLREVGADVSEIPLEGDLTNTKWDSKDLRNCDLSNRNLVGASFRGANLSCANLANSNLCGTDLTGAYLNKSVLKGTNLTGAQLVGAVFYDADLRGAQLRQVLLHGRLESPMPGQWIPMEHYFGVATFYRTRFVDVDLSSMNLSGISFDSSIFLNSNLNSIDATGTNFNNAVFTSSDLSNSKFSGAQFSGAEFNSANFSNSEELILD